MRLRPKIKNSRGEIIFEGLSAVEIENVIALVNLHLRDEHPDDEWPSSEEVKAFVLEDDEAMRRIRLPWEEARAEVNAKGR